MNTGLLLVVTGIALSSLVQCFTDPRITREFRRKSLIALGVYAAHTAIGIWILIFLLPPGNSPTGIAAAFLGWVGLGALGLVRLAPRLREPPALLLRFGVADAVCLALIGGGIAAAAGLI